MVVWQKQERNAVCSWSSTIVTKEKGAAAVGASGLSKMRPYAFGSASPAGEPVAQRVFRELRSAIVTMALTPGQALSENEIATRLGVSRQPVREAFIKLGEAGLVRIRPQRGTFVVKISTKQVKDARFVREAVEVAVVREACKGMRAEDLAHLERLVEEQRDAAADPDPARFLSLDEAFHRALAIGVDCDYAWRIVEEVKAQMDRVRYLSLPHATPMQRLVEQHAAILAAVKAGDPAAGEDAVRIHLSEILTSLPVLEGRFPDMFEERTPTPIAPDDEHAGA
jgi:DNA-binding GntR family transcriptional regulator